MKDKHQDHQYLSCTTCIDIQEHRNFECDECEMKYTVLQNLTFHKNIVHRGQRVVCHICSTTVRGIKVLHEHVLRVHPDHKWSRCKKCHKAKVTFVNVNESEVESSHAKLRKRSRINYAQEIMDDDDGLTKDFFLKCPNCDKTFDLNIKLNRHLANKCSQKTMQCDLCDYETSNFEELRRHSLKAHLT